MTQPCSTLGAWRPLRYPCDSGGAQAENQDVLFENIKAARYEFAAAEWASISEEAKGLVRALLEPDPDKRITAEAASAHRWITSAGGALESILQA